MSIIIPEHIKEIRVMLGDETFGDYAIVKLSNPNNYYSLIDFEQKKYKLKSGYREYGTVSDFLENVFRGYTLIGEKESYTLPKTIEFSLQNRFFMLGRSSYGSTEFTGKTLQEALSFFISILRLSSSEYVISTPFLNKKIIKAEFRDTMFLDIMKKIAEAFNLWIYWNYDGVLIMKNREIPATSSFTITTDKSNLKTSIEPFKVPNKIVVVGRQLEPWEQTAPSQTLFKKKHLALDFTWMGQSNYFFITSQTFTCNYSIKPAWATGITLTQNPYYCTTVYNSDFTYIAEDYAIVKVWVIDTTCYEKHFQQDDPAILDRIFFDLKLTGYRITNIEKYSRVYVEYIDSILRDKYGGTIIHRIDNEIIPDTEVANAILNFEKQFTTMWKFPVEIEIPLNPLIERYDRITVNAGSEVFDVFITGLEHIFQPYSGKSKTILHGYKIP